MSRIWNWLRYPRTTQELRAGAVRTKRASLPTAWDDIPRRPQRSWKVHRRTAYHSLRHIKGS